MAITFATRAHTDFNINSYKYSETETSYRESPTEKILTITHNQNAEYSKKTFLFAFDKELKSGTYTFGEPGSPFSRVTYTESSSNGSLTLGIVYTANSGSIKAEVTSNPEGPHYVFDFSLVTKNLYGTTMPLEVHSDIKIIKYST